MHLKKYNITVASYTYTMSYVAGLKMTLPDVMMYRKSHDVVINFMSLLYIFQARAKTIMAMEMVISGKRTAKRGVKTFTDTSVMLIVLITEDIGQRVSEI